MSLTPEQALLDALAHALGRAYQEQAGLPEREAYETAMEVLERHGARADLLAHDVLNTLRKLAELPQMTVFDARPGEEPLAERARREAG